MGGRAEACGRHLGSCTDRMQWGSSGDTTRTAASQGWGRISRWSSRRPRRSRAAGRKAKISTVRPKRQHAAGARRTRQAQWPVPAALRLPAYPTNGPRCSASATRSALVTTCPRARGHPCRSTSDSASARMPGCACVPETRSLAANPPQKIVPCTRAQCPAQQGPGLQTRYVPLRSICGFPFVMPWMATQMAPGTLTLHGGATCPESFQRRGGAGVALCVGAGSETRHVVRLHEACLPMQ